MKDCKISDDGKVHGTEAEVLAYEEGLKNPLGRMRFPYHVEATWPNENLLRIFGADRITANCHPEADVLVAFANLAPLLAEWDEARFIMGGDRFEDSVRALANGFREACALIPKP